jgi:hypothetical protein
MFLSAVLALVAIALYAYATVHGELAIVSVLGSLSPAVTVLLAYRVHGERVRRVQSLGTASELAGRRPDVRRLTRKNGRAPSMRFRALCALSSWRSESSAHTKCSVFEIVAMFYQGPWSRCR